MIKNIYTMIRKILLGLLFLFLLFIFILKLKGYSLTPPTCQNTKYAMCKPMVYHFWPFPGLPVYACYCVHI